MTDNSAPKVLRIDEKWSISYDPAHNDRPLSWLRYGQPWSAEPEWAENNAVTALFYALLEERGPWPTTPKQGEESATPTDLVGPADPD